MRVKSRNPAIRQVPRRHGFRGSPRYIIWTIPSEGQCLQSDDLRWVVKDDPVAVSTYLLFLPLLLGPKIAAQ
jgi:hypothetical protein